MFSDAEMQLLYKVGNAPINTFPYPHFYINDIFPADFYREIQNNLPDPEAMIPIEQARNLKGYDERFVLDMTPKSLARLPDQKREFWTELNKMLVIKGSVGLSIFNRLLPQIEKRFEGQTGMEFYSEALLVQDITNYKLGPHTDATRKVVTMLFYLPPDESQKHMGTSIYVPKDPEFRCPGGPHYPHDGFKRMHTNPFVPNALFGFLKTDNSFHGVEPVKDPNTRRWLLLYDIFVRETAPKVQKEIKVKPQVNFSF